MCSLSKAREAIYKARGLVYAAIEEHGELFGLEDANNLLIDAAAQISGEIAKQLPERPIYEKCP
jgi:hypothetical protein